MRLLIQLIMFCMKLGGGGHGGLGGGASFCTMMVVVLELPPMLAIGFLGFSDDSESFERIW